MISAKLMKELEQQGFELDFPSHDSNEHRIIEIMKVGNPRLYLAIPLLLREEFDYEMIHRSLKGIDILKFRQIVKITSKIFKLEGIDDKHIRKIIKKFKITESSSREELDTYRSSFKLSLKRQMRYERLRETRKLDLRSKLNITEALSNIYAPGKRRIMDKIFNHERLTDSELKYYYRSIRPLIRSILNENLQKYVRIIESSKKLH